MELKELIKITKGVLINDYRNIKINSFKTDTRKLKKGDVFIALKGNNYDGNDFINDKMCASAVITNKKIKLKNIPVIKVDDTYLSLFYIGNYIRCNHMKNVIAITGSNGKTTLKELIYSILIKKYNVLKNEGNKNNLVGVFETINNYKDEDISIFELGMNHKYEIDKLSKMIVPNTAVITNIGSSHIGNLGSRKNIFKAKMEIVNGLVGMLIVNGDNKYLKKVKAYKCGRCVNNDLIAYNIHVYQTYLTFNIYNNKEYEVIFRKPIVDYIPSIVEAIKIGLLYSVPMKDILIAIKNYKSYDKRLNEIILNNYTIYDDSYNASFESVKCGLSFLKNIEAKKIIILGDMLELGKYSKKYHKKINFLLNKIDNKEVLTVGNYTKYINSIHFKDNNSLISYLKNIQFNKVVIYVKGSYGMHLNEIVNFLKNNDC